MMQPDVAGYRELLFLYYFGLFGSSIGWHVNESPSVSESLSPTGYFVWLSILGVGGVFGSVGVLRRKHPLELVGLVACVGALAVYMLALVFADPLKDDAGVNWGLACLILALGLSCTIRARVIWHQMTVRERVRREIGDAEQSR